MEERKVKEYKEKDYLPVKKPKEFTKPKNRELKKSKKKHRRL
jgi:hypothetical protein